MPACLEYPEMLPIHQLGLDARGQGCLRLSVCVCPYASDCDVLLPWSLIVPTKMIPWHR